MKKVKSIISVMWAVLMGMATPIWIAIIYMDITGHAKGYGYDLGDEKDISIAMGVFELIIWIAAVFPVLISLCRKLYLRDKRMCLLPVLGFVIIGAVVILLIGWNEYLKCFGVV